MKTTEDRRALIQEVAEHLNINVSDCNDKKVATPRTEYQKECSKVVTLEEAIRKVGLKDGMTIYMSEGTADALETDGVSLCAALDQFNVGSLDIVPFTTFHDAAEPLGFLIKSRVDGDVLAFATDTVNLRYRFPGLNVLLLFLKELSG